MRRILLVTLLLAAAGAYVLTSTGAKEESGNEFTVEFDNAFALAGAGGSGQFEVIPPELRGQTLEATIERGQNNRCPGGGEHRADDGSSPYKPSSDYPCDASQVLPGE